MSALPAITLSSLDVERIERLLEKLPPAQAPQADLLLGEFARARVLAPARIPPDVVTMNSRVRFSLVPGGVTREMTLVYPRDADGSADRVSVLAPAGAAMLGLRVGDRMVWPAPDGGTLDVCIEALVYQPESAGDLHR